MPLRPNVYVGWGLTVILPFSPSALRVHLFLVTFAVSVMSSSLAYV